MRIKLILKFHKLKFAVLLVDFLYIFFPAYIFATIFGKPKASLISARTDWFISVITGLIELI